MSTETVSPQIHSGYAGLGRLVGPVFRPETRYARSGDVHIAYQVMGRGPIDVIFVQGFLSNLETQWEDPGLTHLFSRLASFARLIIFDKRGSGLSDRVADMPDLETRMDDVRVVMDAAGSREAVLLGASEGGPMSILFAATYPRRTRALVLYGAYAHFHSWVLSPEQVEAFVVVAATRWGDGSTLGSFCPNLVGNERFRAWWARFERLGASPAGAIALARMNSQIDVRGVLDAVRVPTLVIHRDRDARVQPAAGRYLARHIAGARLVELPGVDHPIWVGDTDRVVDEIEEFVTGVRPAAEPDRVLATILAVDLADAGRRAGAPAGSWLDQSHDLRDRFEALLRDHRGRTIARRPDGIAAVFDGPVRALRCALAFRQAASHAGVRLHAGVHAGEVEVAGDEVGGAVVLVTARIAAMARAGEVLVSTTVRDIVPGCGLRFTSSGMRLADGEDGPGLLSLEADPVRRPVSEATLLAGLTARERDILAALACGHTNAEIAAARGLSQHTVKRHVANLLGKLDLSNRAAAAAFATRQAQHAEPVEGGAMRR